MTATTQGLTGQGLAGLPAQQGTFGSGFGPFTAGSLPSISPEQYALAPSPFGIPSQLGYPQQQFGSALHQPVVQQIAAQVVPIAQQVILPQVLAMAMQQIQQQMPYVIAQLAGQFAGQQSWQWPSQPSSQLGMGQFGQVRPYAYS